MRTLAIALALSLTPSIFGQNGLLVPVAGNGTTGTSGAGGPSVNAALTGGAICVDRFDNIYVADPSNNRVVKIDTNGILTLLAGNGAASSTGTRLGHSRIAEQPHRRGRGFIGDVLLRGGQWQPGAYDPSTGTFSQWRAAASPGLRKMAARR